MKHSVSQNTEKYTRTRRQKRRWYQIVTCMAAVVVFCTVYALILPAITMENVQCGLTEHIHDESCYRQVAAAERTELACTAGSIDPSLLSVYTIDEDGNWVKGYADFVVHRHDASCYDENDRLICPLPEIQAHRHTGSCYASSPDTSASHTHDENCYTTQRGALICTENESEGHIHTEACYTETSSLVCEEDHEHGEGCYQTAPELTCGLTEELGHQHTDACYEQQKILTCAQTEAAEEETEKAEPALICGKEEIILHEHTSACFNDYGVLVCGQTQILEHVHTAECFRTARNDYDNTLTCGTAESEGHQHTALRYGNWELVCTKTVHTHDSTCYAADESDSSSSESSKEPDNGSSESSKEPDSSSSESSKEPDSSSSESSKEPDSSSSESSEEPDNGSSESNTDTETDTETETKADWEASLAGVILTGDYRKDVLAIAQTQLGYTAQIITDENGQQRQISRYGQWYGDPYGEWDAMFVSFCLSYGGVRNMPMEADCQRWVQSLRAYGLFKEMDAYTPQPGDIVFLDEDSDGIADHVSLIYTVISAGSMAPYRLETIERTADGRVWYGNYPLSAASVLGYGTLPEQKQEEIDRVNEVIALIEALPAAESVERTLAALEEAGNMDGCEAYRTRVRAQAKEVREAYDALTALQQAEVTNIRNLSDLEQLLDAYTVHSDPSLTDDGAFVRELRADGIEIISDREQTAETSSDIQQTVRAGETAAFSFSLSAASYTDTCYRDGRVKLEIVLPWAEEQAAFDLSRMTWLDRSAGYAPVVTAETRLIDGTERSCQVLTGYIQLSPQENGGIAVPGSFAGAVYVTVVDMQHGDAVNLQISAAMEYGAWDGICADHGMQEKLTVATAAVTVSAQLSEEERQALYDGFAAEIEALETAGELDEEQLAAADDIRQRLEETYKQGGLSDEQYMELYGRLTALLSGDLNAIAEAAVGTNWILLRDSGWFEAYSGYDHAQSYAMDTGYRLTALMADEEDTASAPPSGVQVDKPGGTNTSEDGSVSVSKTIAGTELENVFDITLQVQTSQNIAEAIEEPDMAVVIVMDISNTMKSDFGDRTRYEAAMLAAEQFLDQFAANNSLGISKVGYVAFNTNGHKIFDLQSCSTQEQANALKNTMRTVTGNIINQDDYGEWYNRNKFTNMEAGLAVARDMLAGATNENKYVIFLSDGFPTTYIKSGYTGHVPIHKVSDDTHNYIRDDLYPEKPFTYGTNYSDRGAVKAREMATSMKNSGITIFSIGVNVSGQSLEAYITQSEKESYSTMDRTSATYDVGGTGTGYFESWLRNSIGSGYYYDSTDSAGLSAAYNKIFAEIKHQIAEGSEADWVASDPLPTISGAAEDVEFIGFYNNSPALVSGDLTGSHTAGGENTAAFNTSASAISWDLKKSGYTKTTSGSTTTYTYQLVYRVRLKNEGSSFAEGTVYPTNDTTTLQYRNIQGTDGNLTVSEPKTIEFPIPSVHGYLTDLTFKKVDLNERPLAGAEFTLRHDTEHCGVCRGNRTSVTIADMVATSEANGTVSFTKIPSGHKYTLTETKVPPGYSASGDTYTVEVAYDTVTVMVNGSSDGWNDRIVNRNYYELPNTGGTGTILYTIGGLLLTGIGFILLYSYIRRRKEDAKSS